MPFGESSLISRQPTCQLGTTAGDASDDGVVRTQEAQGGTTGATVCGIKLDALQVLDEDWEAACFVEKCPACFAAVTGRN
jgi:hypothetical protein